MNDEKSLVVSKPGYEFSKSYYLLFESISEFLNANLEENARGEYHRGDESTSMRMLHRLAILTEKIICPNVANLLYRFYSNLLKSKVNIYKGALFLAMKNFASFSFLYESYFDFCLEVASVLARMC